MKAIQVLVHGLIELPPSVSAPMEAGLAAAVARLAGREGAREGLGGRSATDLPYLWEAIDASHTVRTRLAGWARDAGDCWMLNDRARRRAWLVSPEDAPRLAREDCYLIPCADPSVCYVSPHEEEFGPFVIRFNEEERAAFEVANWKGNPPKIS